MINNGWIEDDIENGIGIVTFKTWRDFLNYFHDEMLDYPNYIWRGQKDSTWLLESTLERVLKKKTRKAVNEHLENFKYSVRGRRGNNPPKMKNENDWWALGQHYGLATPLLDWSYSPFVSAFFAFEKDDKDIEYRAIYALNIDSVNDYPIINSLNTSKRYANIESIRPLSDENSRLVSQSGEFTRAPIGIDIEKWIRKMHEDEDETYILMKFLIPNKERDVCLRYLNKMNINHLTLFPDLRGSSDYSNMKSSIKNY